MLQLDDRQLADVARACNRYPNVELSYNLADEAVTAGENSTVVVALEREDDNPEVGAVIAPFYPQKKDEGWWLVLGDTQTNALLAIKVPGALAPPRRGEGVGEGPREQGPSIP